MFLPCFLLLVSCIQAEYVFPTIFMSHRLIPGLRGSVDHSSQMPYTLHEANTIIESGVEECLSNAYLVVEIEGLKVDDFSHFEAFPNLRKMMASSSTLISLPNVVSESNKTLDLDLIESSITVNCHAEKVVVKDALNEDELPQYVDTTVRLIEVHFPPLVANSSEKGRIARLTNYDTALHKVVRILPTPNIVVIFTTKTLQDIGMDDLINPETMVNRNEIPENPRLIDLGLKEKMRKSRRMILPDITVFDRSRYYDYERNAKDISTDAEKSKKKRQQETWLKKKTKKIVKERSLYRFGEQSGEIMSALSSSSFVHDNAALILSAFAVIALMVFWDVSRITFKLIGMIIRSSGSKNMHKQNKQVKQD